MCIVRDVTERRALEQQLHRAQKLEAVGHLAAGIAHEINTPMQYIGDNLTFTCESVAELLPLVSMLLGKLEGAANAILTADDLKAVQGALGSADFDYVRETLPRALDASLDGVSRVTVIETRRHEDCAELRVSDTGGGIPEHLRAKVFDPFFTTKEVGKGTGQGLAMAHTTIVGRHQGTLHFETEMGRGTTFIIRLSLSRNPRAAKRAAAPRERTERGAKCPWGQRKTNSIPMLG